MSRQMMNAANFFKVVLVLSSFLCVCTSADFDYFVYAQQWPVTACMEGNKTGHKCVIPQEVTTWVVHGLWPSRNDNPDEPVSCNSSWPFNGNKVQPLLADLEKYWPNMYTDTAVDSFWSHEWEKHGTCSTQIPATADEYSYFKKGLALNQQNDILTTLNHYNVTVGTNTTLDYLETIFKEAFKANLNIGCLFGKKHSHKQYLYEIEICMTKSFELISCPKSFYTGDRFGKSSSHVLVHSGPSYVHQLVYQMSTVLSTYGPCNRKEPIYYPTL